MAGYGYTKPSYGYYNPTGRGDFPGASTQLATAAAKKPSAYDPFGLSGPQNAGAAPGSAPPISYGNPKPAQPAAAAPQQTGAAVNPQGQGVNTAPTAPAAYDINTDPALQQIQALTGMNDEQARAQAKKQ
jgi:hypothetical protein